MAEWAAMEILISIENGKVLVEISNGDEELELRLNHELAIVVGKALLDKAAEVEYEISSAVERLTNLG